MSGPRVTIDAVSRHFAESANPAVSNVSLTVQPGSVLALLGPSGAGKTTLLRIIAGFERTDAGRVLMDERVVSSADYSEPPEKRGIGFVFQHGALFPHLTVRANIEFGLKQMNNKERNGRVLMLEEMCALQNLLHRYPHELSGGEQQRAALARALARGSKTVLLDEPLSNVDVSRRAEIGGQLRAILRSAGITSILVTHDHDDAFALADSIAVMRNGAIEQTGTPEQVYFSPVSPFVARFLSDANILPGRFTPHGLETEIFTFPPDDKLSGDGSAEVMLRPADLQVLPDLAGDSEIVGMRFAGASRVYSVRLASGRVLQCAVSGVDGQRLEVGTTVRVVPRMGCGRCFMNTVAIQGIKSKL